jgi:hypothetical protein
MNLTDLADQIARGPAGELLTTAIEEQNYPPRVDDKYRQLGLAEPLGKTTTSSGSPRHAPGPGRSEEKSRFIYIEMVSRERSVSVKSLGRTIAQFPP